MMTARPRRRAPSQPAPAAHVLRAVSRRARSLLTVLAAALALAAPVLAQSDAAEAACAGGGYNPTPVEVAVTAVPIVVASTTADYFVLYVKHDMDGTEVEIPVAVTRGEADTTTLAENVEALPAERYRVEKYLVANPADVDGDCVDDISELADLGKMNPVNPTVAIELRDGAAAVPDRDTFDALSYDESHLKFLLFDMYTDRPRVYFMNTKTHQHHQFFLDAVGIDRDVRVIKGEITYDAELVAPDGSTGIYYFERFYVSIYSFSFLARVYSIVAASMPLLEDNLAFHMPNLALPYSQPDLPLYRESRIPLVFDEDISPETGFLALNPGDGYGRLRVMDLDERPNARDIVIYEALPNELPRIAGIITTVPQTPLSHVNLRAVQDGAPNAFIRGALDKPKIDALIGSYVRYEVTEGGWELRAATRAEVDAHYAASRPAGVQTPQRDLSVTAITPLSEIGFEDWKVFGVKAANVAVLRTLGFPAGTVPDGFAIPFYFYDAFMKAHDFYTRIETMLADENFQTDFDTQDDMLDDLRDDIKDAATPQWISDALTTMHATFPEGASLRYRSSTNNEDLPGFNGAGLYDSKTQHPDETAEDGIDKSLKQVYASLWNFRAFTERDFHRIDHLAAAMGILVHPNYSDELRNGVAVSFDPIYGGAGRYYINTQLGEDLVTNPEAHSVPEEILLYRDADYLRYSVLATSNQVPPGQLLMTNDQLAQLRRHLTVIHDEFKKLYQPASGEPFAMEIEFKITSEDVLAIKQARPWVFSGASQTLPPVPPPEPSSPPPPTGNGGGGGSSSGGGSRAPSPPPAPPRSPIIGSTPAATAVELAGDLMVLQRHDEPGVEVEVGIGWISRDGERIIVIGFVRDRDLGQTYAVVRREGDGQVVRRWIAPDSHLVYAVPWAVVNAQYTFPVGVIEAIPLDDQYPPPNMLMRRFDGGDDRILAYDAELGQWRHVPDLATFQARGYYWCNVTAADAGFFDRITLGPPYPASNVPARADYPVCQT